MAVAFVNANTITAATASPISVARSVTAGANCAVAIICYDQVAGMSVTSVTYGGQNMTAAGTAAHEATKHSYVEVWSLVNPPTGSNTLAITVAGTVTDIYYNLVSFSGVNQTTPIRAGTYQATTPTSSAGGQVSVVVSSNTSDLTLTAINSPSGNTGTNQTSDGISTAGAYSGASDHATTAASSVTHTWSGLGATQPVSIVGFSINGDPNSSGAAWPLGTRQAPGQKGPFNPLGFLTQPMLSYVPSAAVAQTFIFRMRDLDGLSGQGAPMKNPLE